MPEAPQEKRCYPFYCGSQHMDWRAYNCDQCTKQYDERAKDWRCDLEKKIDESAMGDGSFDVATAQRMGQPADCTVYNWRCPEFERAPEPPPARPKHSPTNQPADWIVEWAARRGITLPRD